MFQANFIYFNKQKKDIVKKHFTHEEDERLKYLVQQFGDKNWGMVASYMPGRQPRQCRERYIGYLSPFIHTKPWTQAEDYLLLQKLLEIGPKWMKMVPFFDGRSDSNIKNRWHRHLKKRVSPSYMNSIPHKSKANIIYTKYQGQSSSPEEQNNANTIVEIQSCTIDPNLQVNSSSIFQFFKDDVNGDMFDIFNMDTIDDF